MRRFFSSSGLEAGILCEGENDGVEHTTTLRIARERRGNHGVGEKNTVAQPERGSPEYAHDNQSDAPSQSRLHNGVGDEESYDNKEYARVGDPCKGLLGSTVRVRALQQLPPATMLSRVEMSSE